MEPAIPSAPLAKSARVEGSGTEGTGGTMVVAENTVDPVAFALKVKLARVFVKPAAERSAMPEKFKTDPTVVSLSVSRAMVKVPMKN